MDPSDNIDLIKNLLAIIGTLWGILANWSKGWETALKVWAWACSVSMFLNKKKTAYVKKWRSMIDTDEAREETPTPPAPVCINVYDTVPMGLHDGYTVLRHRQNAYYDSQGSQYWGSPANLHITDQVPSTFIT